MLLDDVNEMFGTNIEEENIDTMVVGFLHR